ncbi:MAG: hypothetical protein JJ855_04310 [Rhodospirillales bacterium]|nr:hypothetical protein [Rhodospirillales bacterium]
MQENKTSLKMLLKSVWVALSGSDENFSGFPEDVDGDGNATRTNTKDSIQRIIHKIESYPALTEKEVRFLIERGRESLDEVKELTEYEDQKAIRNLTVVTFLSALTGVLFSDFSDAFPLNAYWSSDYSHFEKGLVFANYFLFSTFIICAISGALVVFHATRIRFKYPELRDNLNKEGRSQKTKSYLFFPEIVSVEPENWAASFFEHFQGNAQRPNGGIERLGLEYVKNYIVESYLVAAKVSDKLNALRPGQTLLNVSIKILFFWAIVFILGSVFLAETSEANSTSASIRLEEASRQKDAGDQSVSRIDKCCRSILHTESLYRQRMGLGETYIPFP